MARRADTPPYAGSAHCLLHLLCDLLCAAGGVCAAQVLDCLRSGCLHPLLRGLPDPLRGLVPPGARYVLVLLQAGAGELSPPEPDDHHRPDHLPGHLRPLPEWAAPTPAHHRRRSPQPAGHPAAQVRYAHQCLSLHPRVYDGQCSSGRCPVPGAERGTPPAGVSDGAVGAHLPVHRLPETALGGGCGLRRRPGRGSGRSAPSEQRGYGHL